MLAYPIAEAETLLEGKLSGAQQTLENCEEDLDFLREQITVRYLTLFRRLFELIAGWVQTLEVATARVYNWDVSMKRKEKAECAEEVKGEKKVLPNG